MSETGHLGSNLGVIAVATALAVAPLTVFAGNAWVPWAMLITFSALWVTGALALSDGASRRFLAGTLRKSTYTQIYTTLTRRLVTRIWNALCDPVADRAPVYGLFWGALTWRLYDKALLIAVVYPILLLIGQWVVTGEAARIGGFVMLQGAPFWWDRAMTIAAVALFAAAISARLLIPTHAPKMLRVAVRWLPTFLIIALAIFFLWLERDASDTLALVGSTFFLLALSFSFAVSLVGVFPGAVAFAATFGGSGLPAFFVALIAYVLDRRGRPRIARWVVTIFAVIAIPAFATMLSELVSVAGAVAPPTLLVFLAVLPLLNALFDTASYAVTLALMKRGLRSRMPLIWGLLDLALACLLFLALGATLVLVLHGLNMLAGLPLVDLPALFAGINEAPGDYIWLYLMLFSTILPTALHAGLSLLGVQGLWPRAPRRVVAVWVEAAETSALAAVRAGLALAVVWAVPLLILGAVLWGLWALGGGAVLWLLGRYFDALLWLAAIPAGAI